MDRPTGQGLRAYYVAVGAAAAKLVGVLLPASHVQDLSITNPVSCCAAATGHTRGAAGGFARGRQAGLRRGLQLTGLSGCCGSSTAHTQQRLQPGCPGEGERGLQVSAVCCGQCCAASDAAASCQQQTLCRRALRAVLLPWMRAAQHSDMELHNMEQQVVQLKRALQSLLPQQAGEGEVLSALLLHREPCIRKPCCCKESSTH